ncbi:MAG: MinD/ParA family ATP-binding protein [Candidatus Hodarchaeales archaeon]|jgi:MinD-like ATPase involved in chromosome partitioning or flagellar assembly
MSQIITIHSFKGGNGKSLISSALAYFCASISNEKTIIIDCDFEAPSLNTFFKHKSPPQKTIIDFLDGHESIEDIITKSDLTENLDIIFAPDPTKGKKILTMDEEWYVKTLQRMVSALNTLTDKLNYKWIIFDNQSGLSRHSTNFLMLSTSVIVILRPSRYAAQGSLDLIKSFFSKLFPFNENIRSDFLLWNQIPQGGKQKEVEQLINSFNQQFIQNRIKPIGQIKYDDDLASLLFLKEQFDINQISTYLMKHIQVIVESLSA